MYSPNPEECGRQCGVVQDLFFKVADCNNFYRLIAGENVTTFQHDFTENGQESVLQVAGSRSGGVWPVPAKVK